MSKSHIAKLFKNGASQAVRLPAEFRFDGEEVFIHRNAAGDVVLSTRPASQGWDEFFELLKEIDPADPVTRDFMAERALNAAPKAQGVFDDVCE